MRVDAAVAESHSTVADGVRIEEAALNALQTQRQLFFDGWLLRLSPGSAKRARSVNAHFGSTLPVDAKIDCCEALYGGCGLPTLFRVTPFGHPADLDDVLARRGYRRFDATVVQSVALTAANGAARGSTAPIEAASIATFVDVVAALRASTRVERDAHFERLSNTPLATHAVVVRKDGHAVACGQVAVHAGLAGIYDMVTSAAHCGHGLATSIVAALMAWARAHGAGCAFLQVTDDNAAARAVYAKFGFATVYAYHYRARGGECW
jgi:GNAT superfamily N-acetyltransferase